MAEHNLTPAEHIDRAEYLALGANKSKGGNNELLASLALVHAKIAEVKLLMETTPKLKPTPPHAALSPWMYRPSPTGPRPYNGVVPPVSGTAEAVAAVSAALQADLDRFDDESPHGGPVPPVSGTAEAVALSLYSNADPSIPTIDELKEKQEQRNVAELRDSLAREGLREGE